MNNTTPIAAIVVTYFPDDRITDRLAAIRREVERLVIVDNGSSPEIRVKLESWAAQNSASILASTENRGLAAALNQGLVWSESEGCEWAITFDQDSTPQSGLAAALMATALSSAMPDQVAIVGAHTFDERSGRDDRWLQPAWFGFRRKSCGQADLVGVTFVITSGALTHVRAWRKLGGFDEGLFIDYLDHDLCLRARKAGWQVLVSSAARLAHNLGSKRGVVVAGRMLRPTFHSAVRHYYMARNRIIMWKRYAFRFPHWWLFDVLFGALNTLRVLLAEDERRQKLTAISGGTWHGILGRSGSLDEASNRKASCTHDS